MLIINPAWHCNLPITGVDAYPCSRLFIILGYFWTTWNCCATLVFSNLNPKTNGTSSELRLWHLHSSFRLLSATRWLENTQRQIPHDNASTIKKKFSLSFSGGGSRCFTQNAPNFLLMIPPASVKAERAFSWTGISKLRSRISVPVM